MARGDMFLKIDSTRKGVIKGEAHDPAHLEEIDVFGWSWGMQAQTGMGAGGPATKTQIEELDINKRIDSASTALMSAMRENELIRKATLTVRKAGMHPLEFFQIVLENARITALHVYSEDHELAEKLTFAFQTINVQYTPQGPDGGPRGKMSFETETSLPT